MNKNDDCISFFFLGNVCADTRASENTDGILPWTLHPALLEVNRNSFIHLNETGYRLEFPVLSCQEKLPLGPQI